MTFSPNAGIAEQIPADEVGVAAVVRIAERALQRVRAHHGEERAGAAGEAGGRSGLDVDQHRILIALRELDERRAARRSAVAIERGEAGAIRLARFLERAAQRAIDVVRRPRLARARAVRVGRNDARADRLEQVGFGRGEVFERLAPRRRRLRRRAGAGRACSAGSPALPARQES